MLGRFTRYRCFMEVTTLVNRQARRPRPKTADAKSKVVNFIRDGKTVVQAMELVGRTEKTYELWRKSDPEFKASVDHVRALAATAAPDKRLAHACDFVTFRKRYLGMETFDHQRAWIDLIEGREPEGLHPAVTYEKGDPNFVMINVPPEHAKSMTLSIDFITYRVCMNPDERVLIVSETQKRAKEFLYGVKQRMTHPRYRDLQLAFAPAEGFEATADSWRDDYIYLGSELRDSPEKDPTIQALGVAGQIYGARATLILLDDVVVLSNAHRFEDQRKWIQQEVLTRLGPTGKLIIAGTRVAPVDLYTDLRNPDSYPDGKSPWSYLAMPAVLEFADDADDWVTLWPRSDHPWPGDTTPADEDGLYPRWSGAHLKRRRGLIDPRTWAMVYQQANTAEHMIFDMAKIRACVAAGRTVGPMYGHIRYHRPEGMDGLYIVCSMDPAMAGDTATIAYAVDLKTHKRYLLDAHLMSAPTPQRIRDLIMAWTDRYKPQCWVIEKNAFQLFLTRDEEIRSYLASRGVIMREHYTGSNKLDPDFGVASLAPLFDSQLIELPSTHNSEAMKALVEQFVTWVPGTRGKDLKMDLPMAVWFAELIIREVTDAHVSAAKKHQANRFVPRYRREKQVVVRLDEFLSERAGGHDAGYRLRAM
jgi:hypothetical protein